MMKNGKIKPTNFLSKFVDFLCLPLKIATLSEYSYNAISYIKKFFSN